MRINRLNVVLCGLILAALLSAVAHADIVATNLGPGQTYNTNSGWVVAEQTIATPFVPTQTVTLTDAVLAVGWYSGTTPINVYVESSTGNGPGMILDILSQVGTFQSDDASHLVDFTCSSCSQLDAGTLYFLVAQQSNPSTGSNWDMALNSSGSFYYNFINSATGPWNLQANSNLGAFEVNGTPSVATTPEPSSIALLATGLIGAVGTFRRKIFKA